MIGLRGTALTAALFIGGTLAACTGSTLDPSSSGPRPARTALPRPLSAAEQNVLGAANAYSFDLWKTINAAQKDSNVFVSPLSASFALGMTMNGASGSTLDEMRSSLRFGSTPLTSIDSGYRSLIALLTSLDPSTTMNIANAIFYRTGFPFNQSFFDDTKSYFDAQVSAQNFADVPGTLAAVNGWASSKTNGRIPKVLGDVESNAVMFLLNAIYFKGTWRERFDPANTRNAPFHPAVGADQPAKLMSRQGKTAYAETNAYQAVDLAYGDSSFTMTVILPKAGNTVETVAASLTPDTWQALGNSFRTSEVELFLPKISLSWQRGLKSDMKALGMISAFVPDGADFTGMSTSKGKELFISLLQQNTFVAIDEVGTEAAAVTTVGVSLTSMPVVTPMRVDRPYIVVIRERFSGTVLFMGKIVSLPQS